MRIFENQYTIERFEQKFKTFSCIILSAMLIYSLIAWQIDYNDLKHKEEKLKQMNTVVEKAKKEQKKIRKKIKKYECGRGHIFSAKNKVKKINYKNDNLYFYKGKIFKIEKVNIE